MTDLATLKNQLSEAQQAMHELMLGNKYVAISYNGRSVQKTAADAPNLRMYIKDLKAQIARLEGRSSRGPLSLHA